MAALTIKQIHAILSGTFSAGVRWEWIGRNPVASTKLPKVPPRRPSCPQPDQVAKVIAAARDLGLELLALYLWLAAVHGGASCAACSAPILTWTGVSCTWGAVTLGH
jgi:integrase